mmetsp:Transcript_47133/g.143249  ORF Transcript_47133/g.143249 Transcript_47133/m.143249 type:complete len:287 (+) Transcript_47133:240-1100(+)
MCAKNSSAPASPPPDGPPAGGSDAAAWMLAVCTKHEKFCNSCFAPRRTVKHATPDRSATSTVNSRQTPRAKPGWFAEGAASATATVNAGWSARSAMGADHWEADAKPKGRNCSANGARPPCCRAGGCDPAFQRKKLADLPDSTRTSVRASLAARTSSASPSTWLYTTTCGNTEMTWQSAPKANSGAAASACKHTCAGWRASPEAFTASPRNVAKVCNGPAPWQPGNFACAISRHRKREVESVELAAKKYFKSFSRSRACGKQSSSVILPRTLGNGEAHLSGKRDEE